MTADELLELADWLRLRSPREMKDLAKEVSQLPSFDAVIEHLQQVRNRTLN